MRTELKVFRTRQKLTQLEMAKRCKTGRDNYCSIENGKRNGGVNFWFSLGEAFGLSLEELKNLMKTD